MTLIVSGIHPGATFYRQGGKAVQLQTVCVQLPGYISTLKEVSLPRLPSTQFLTGNPGHVSGT